MRKLMSKKGFTLVELMIVVVILGILVAVAVPIFSAVTKNARTKTCASNIRIIKSNCSTYYMSGDNGDPVTNTSKTDPSKETAFLALFDGNKLPVCPAGTAAYTIAVTFTGTTATEYKVTCPNYGEDHQPSNSEVKAAGGNGGNGGNG